MKKRIRLPWYIKDVLRTLDKANFECYVVGGAVRDSLLGRPVHDYDITTNALPEQIVELFESKGFTVCPTGIKHGTVTVVNGCYNIEVTTYRIDGDYSDNRRPDSVEFTTSLKEDLSRRDFTINAMAYHPKKGIIDEFGGTKDLKNGIIKCVGYPEKRFEEDALRIIRAIRFANQLDFSVEYDTLFGILRLRDNLKDISVERKREELNKILSTGRQVKGLQFLQEVMPEVFNKNVDTKGNLLLHFSKSESFVQNLTTLIIYDIIKLSSLDYLKYDNKTKILVNNAVNCYHSFKDNEKAIANDNDINSKYILKKEIMSKFSKDEINTAINVILAENSYNCEIAYKALVNMGSIETLKEPVCREDLDINGDDIKSLGYEGERINLAFKTLLEFVWNYPDGNKKETLMNRLRFWR